MQIMPFHHSETGTLTYLVHDQQACLIIDPCLDFNLNTGIISTESIDEILATIIDLNLKLSWVLETHIHADHLTAADYCRQQTGCKVGISTCINQVFETWKKPLALDHDQYQQSFDHYFEKNEKLQINSLSIQIIETPGHTPSCISYLINNQALFVGDALFMPNHGCGRCDFPGGSAKALYTSVQSLYQLDDTVIVYTGHNYPKKDQPFASSAPLKLHKESNLMIPATTSEIDFCKKRTTKDLQLNQPKLIYPALQINLMAGRLPQIDEHGRRYLKIPLEANV
jgi:glyoxylase-like metal-dependent hydrolase (beta-lactamase superfamily II)